MHTTQSGSQQPQGPDAFNPPAQFTAWGDKTATYENRLVVPTDSARTSLAAPELRDGLEVYVTATGQVWVYVVSTWVPGPLALLANVSTFGSNWTPGTGVQVPRVRRIGDRVDIYGAVALAAGGAIANILTIPAAFQPPTTTSRFIGTAVNSGGITVQFALAAGVLLIPAGYLSGSLGVGSLPLNGSWWMD